MSDPRSAFDRRLVAPLIVGSVLNPINTSMIAVALVPIGVAFREPPSHTVWLVTALYLTTAIGQPVVGRLVDLYGPRRLYLLATALVGVAGVLGMLAPSLPVLVGSRVLLGLGTCAAYPAAMSLIRSESERTGLDSPSGVLTALTVANQTVAVVGPTLGGLLIGLGGWRSIFGVNVPLSIACLVLGAWRLPGTRPAPEHRPRLALRRIVGNGPLVVTYLRMMLGGTAAYCFLYGVVPWLQQARGLSATRAGLLLLPLFATALVVSVITGRPPEVRAKLVVGGLAMSAASAVLALTDAGTALWVVVGVCVLAGATQGLNNLANQNAVYHQAEPSQMGASAGLLRTSMYAGAMLASAAVGLSFPHDATTSGLHALALVMLGCSLAQLLLALPDRSLGRIGQPPSDPKKEDLHVPDHA